MTISEVSNQDISAWWGLLVSLVLLAVHWGVSKTKVEQNTKAIAGAMIDFSKLQDSHREAREDNARSAEQLKGLGKSVDEINTSLKEFITESEKMRVIMLLTIAGQSSPEAIKKIQDEISK